MRVEVDASSLPELAFYRDQQCEELEKVLRASSEYRDAVVRRLRQLKEYQNQGDPYDVQDATGKHRLWLYTIEVKTLDNSEIVAFATVQEEREKKADSLIKWLLTGVLLSVLGVSGVVLTLLLDVLFPSFSQQFPAVSVITVLVLLSGVSVLALYRRAYKSMRRKIDISWALENTPFLNALRKLAALSSSRRELARDYDERFRAVEDEMTDSIS